MLMRFAVVDQDMLGFVDAVPSDALQPEDRRSNSLRIVKTHFGVVQNVPKDLRRCPSPTLGTERESRELYPDLTHSRTGQSDRGRLRAGDCRLCSACFVG